MEYKFKQGNLLGFTDSNKNRSAIPDLMIYITRVDGKLTYRYFDADIESGTNLEEYPPMLVVDIHKQGYKIEDIKGLYQLPFDSSSLDKNATLVEGEDEESDKEDDIGNEEDKNEDKNRENWEGSTDVDSDQE